MLSEVSNRSELLLRLTVFQGHVISTLEKMISYFRLLLWKWNCFSIFVLTLLFCGYSLFFKQEMELSLIGLQNAGKTSLVNVVAVSKYINHRCLPITPFYYWLLSFYLVKRLRIYFFLLCFLSSLDWWI